MTLTTDVMLPRNTPTNMFEYNHLHQQGWCVRPVSLGGSPSLLRLLPPVWGHILRWPGSIYTTRVEESRPPPYITLAVCWTSWPYGYHKLIKWRERKETALDLEILQDRGGDKEGTAHTKAAEKRNSWSWNTNIYVASTFRKFNSSIL